MVSSRIRTLLALFSAATASAQTAVDKTGADTAKPPLAVLQSAALNAEKELPSASISPQHYYQLSEAQRERLQQYLPRTYLKLSRRQRVHCVVLGDRSLQGAQSVADPLLQSFPCEFARLLAAKFYYTGGVRLIRPSAGLQAKDQPVIGPEIIMQPVLASSMVQAEAALMSEGLQATPDLVLIALGMEDGWSGTPLASVESGLRDVFALAKKHGIEVIVAGPMLQAADPAEATLARTRGVSSLLHDLCLTEKVLFSDLGDLTRLIAPPPALQTATQSFPVLVRHYQSRLSVEPVGTLSVADNALHTSLGEILFQDVLDGPPPALWSIRSLGSKTTAPDKLAVNLELSSTASTPLHLTVLPLVTSDWLPREVSPEVDVPAGKSQTLPITYVHTDTASASSADGPLRLPLLITSDGKARIHDVTLPQPTPGVSWTSPTSFNHEGAFTPGLQITNSRAEKINAAWELTCLGQKSSGSLSLDPGAADSPAVKLDLAISKETPFRQKVPLGLQIDIEGQKHVFSRHLEILRNIGLKQKVPLSAADGQSSAATLQFDADGQKLFLICDLTGLELSDDRDTGHAYDAFINIDARRYGQRLTPGATAAIHLHGKAGDGLAQIEKIAVWAFGTGYAANYDTKDITAKLASTPDRKRTLTIALPRAYLYDHEWAMGNGNSQLGVNFRLQAAGRSLFLTASHRHPDDAESLAVLELTDKPTLRATVRVE
ncbi:MAG: hypothetical protein IPK32_03035 [Verrucomicrobiaceae bacterium]|nr:hypothetical protein [Verrucomicrobiaceae bacterium]